MEVTGQPSSLGPLRRGAGSAFAIVSAKAVAASAINDGSCQKCGSLSSLVDSTPDPLTGAARATTSVTSRRSGKSLSIAWSTDGATPRS